MESLSRPFQSRKLSNAATTKQPYDGVLSGNRNKFISAGAAIDYREIFGSSQAAGASSIPVLDLSTLGERSTNMMMLDSKPDYSNIFCSSDCYDVAGAVCYQELFASDKYRPPSSSTTTSHDSDNMSRQSSEGLKQFNMSYNKISPKSKDELDGTKHVTQLHAIPGFTRFIDQRVSPPKMKSEKHKSSPVHISVDPSKENEPIGIEIFTAYFSPNHSFYIGPLFSNLLYIEPVSEVTKSKTFDVDAKINPSKVSSPSASPINVVNHKIYPKRSTTMKSKSCKTETLPTSFDKELDVNSAASALKTAIEKAQESIRIAKESVGRKKKGLGNFSNRNKDSSKVKDRTEDVSGATSSNAFPDSLDGEKLSVAKKVIDEMNGKILESNKFKDNNTIVSNSTRVTGETESKPLNSAGIYEHATSPSEAVHTEKNKTEPMEVEHEDQTVNTVVDDYEGKNEVTKTTTSALEHQSVVKEVESVERVEADMFRESKENMDEVRLSNAQESVEKSSNLIVSEKVENEKNVSQESNQCDNETRLKSLENEKQEEVLEQEDVEHAENTESRKGIEEVSNWSESENESEDDNDTEIHEEETNEMFNDVSELETKASVQTFDDKIEESKESAQTYDNSLEESETNLYANCEMKHEDYHTGEKPAELLEKSSVQEFEKMPSCDENVMEETDSVDHIHESCKVDMYDKNMETTQEVSDVTEGVEGADASEVDEVCETDNEDEYELKSEENDGQSDSSGTIDGVKIEDIIDNLQDLGSENDVQSESSSSSAKTVEEESNTQLPEKEIPDTIKDSQEPQYGDKEDDIGEPGPSKVWGKEHFRRIDEETSRERENEKNRLAVNRAIREARERAFIEARERAERERAAVEKATEEVRQRMMADVREKVAKASAATKLSSEKTSAQSKLRSERAAVERATSEARQRALEKAMSQKSVSDLNSSESALRSKAKLEKHNRIMERAAQALAEKEKRDLLAQKEQAERNRLAENLDADIKRWSNGKEGNLRALLSTLQYILGPESGWQAVSLTEILNSSAVKKAYRKATLCVHPDKLQQRGATIQQKYICEKVFDLLKAAWNRFNSDEK